MSDKMVLLALYGNPIEAELVRAQLEAQGIRAYVLGTTSGDLFFGLGVGVSNVQLLVPEGDYERASALLTEETDVGREAREYREREAEAAGQDSTDIRPAVESPLRSEPDAAATPGTVEEGEGELDRIEYPGEDEDEREDISVAWTPDDIAARAFRAAIFGFFICPGLLHLYAVWLVMHISSAAGELSAAGKRNASLAFLIAIGPACLFVFFVLGLILGLVLWLFQ
jgi:hypothetical protein